MRTKQLIFIALLLTICSCTNKTVESTTKPGWLWKISGNGLAQPSYLFGTFHLEGGLQIIDSIEGFHSMFISTKMLVSESKSDASRPFLIKNDTTIRTSLYKPWPVLDSTYENLLSTQQRHTLDSFLNQNGFLKYLYERNSRPNFLRKVAIHSFRKSGDSVVWMPLDSHLQMMANESGIEIISLDTRDHLNYLHDSLFSNVPPMSYKEEMDLLITYIKEHQQIDSQMEARISESFIAYLNQDTSFFSKNLYTRNRNIFSNEISEAGYNLIISERNIFWMTKIPDLIQMNSCFIAVGAGHLFGTHGLIAQLRQLGYNVDSVE